MKDHIAVTPSCFAYDYDLVYVIPDQIYWDQDLVFEANLFTQLINR